MHVFYTPDIAQTLELPEEEAGHCLRVLRLGVGEEIMLTDGSTGFLLELTCLKEHPQAYELGENESHLCFRVSGDYDAIRQYHKENGWVCFENTAMGLYFINDPDDYWIEVLPEK
jgi:lactoylglutathione lyase